MRLDQYLSYTLSLSRSDAKEICRKKRVKVNESIIIDSSFKVNDNDKVYFDEQDLHYQKFIYIMMNKPKGYLSATFDNIDPVVLDLIDGYEKYNLFPIGRLDKDTTGLLIISNDGSLSHVLTSPSKHINKTYVATTIKDLAREDIEKVKNGIMMDDKMTNPITINKLDNKEYEVIISDGKYHEVKRIFEYLDNKVIELKRIGIGNLLLDNSLKEGEYKLLDEEDIKKIF